MKKTILTTLLIMASVPSLAATLADPCEGAADKIACIETKISEQSALIADRIRYLNETPGPTGMQGPQGEPGPQGSDGPQGAKGITGRDTKQALYNEFTTRNQSLTNRSVNISSQILTPGLKVLQIETSGIDAFQRRLADLNRNPNIIGVTPQQRSEADPVWLDFPQGSNGDYLNAFSDTFGKVLYVAGLDSEDNLRIGYMFEGQPVEEHVDTVAEYCTLRPDSTFCSGDYSNLASSRFIGSLDLELLRDAPQELTVTSAREFSIYKLGMDQDDPAFQMVIDHMLGLFGQADFKNAVIDNMNEALGLLDATFDIESNLLQSNIDLANTQEDKDQFQQQLDTLSSEHASSRQAIEDGLVMFESLSSDEYGLRKQRLINYINDSDLLYVTLINSAVQLYWQYKENPNLMSVDERAAWQTFEFRFMYFAEDFLIKWKAAAKKERDLFFQNYVGSNLEGLLGAPSTPDFVDAGATRVGDLYLSKQPKALQDWQTAMAASGVAASLVGVTAAGFGVSAGIAAAKTAGTVAVGLYSAFSTTSVSTATAALGGSTGIASAATGPLAILVVAGIAGVMEGMEVFAQGEKDVRYEAFMNFHIHAEDPGSLHNIDLPLEDRKNMINNMLYMWMISNSQVATD